MSAVERLDHRRHLDSVGGGIVSVRDGLLRVTGTDGGDVIVLERIVENGVDVYQIAMNGEEALFAVARVSRISIRGGAGDDEIAIGRRIGGCYIEADIPTLDNGVNLPGGDDTVYGGGGKDTIIGRTGSDLLFGRGGNDKINAGFGRSAFESPPHADTIYGGDGDDRLAGNFNGEMFGENGDDYLEAGFTENLTVVGGEGDDTMRGGVCSYADSLVGIVLDRSTERDGTFGGRPGEADEIPAASIIVGSPFDDQINTNGGAESSNIVGGAGNDTLTGFRDIDGGAGDDSVLAIGRSQMQFSGLLTGGSGADRIETQERNLTGSGVNYADATQRVSISFDGVANDGSPGEGDNLIGPFWSVYLGSGDDVLNLNEIGWESPQRSVFAGSGNDRLTGLGVLHGEGGSDTLVGTGGGALIAYGGGGRDLLIGSTGRDYLSGGRGRDTIYGGDENDQLVGGADADFIDGGKGRHDILNDESDEDTVVNIP